MSENLLKIAGGAVYDPLHGIDGETRDLWIAGERIVSPPTDPGAIPSRTIDASGLVVMPGGVDMHCHIAGPKVNTARKMRSEEKRCAAVVPRTPITHSGTLGSVPSTFATGYRYAGLGYTTALDAAVSPLAARHAHQELADTPCIDKGFYVLLGNNHYVMQAIKEREPERLRAFVAWLLGTAKAYGAKIVNPGGVESWKQRRAGNVSDLDQKVDHFDVTPRQIIAGLARAADELHLPHAVHIHPNNLGLPGNWTTTLETMKALDGHRGHFAHVQFHSYGGGDADEDTFNSKTVPLVEYFNEHENLTVDVGQVLFGRTTSMTADGPLGYYLHKIYGTKWFSNDTENESGCGIVPIQYKNKSVLHAIQWAIGLEWFLLAEDPWRIALTTDHPNGGSFLAYPHIIHLLMDRNHRQDILKTLPARARRRTRLAELDREYSLLEICTITRAAPARILGLKDKGHLGPGAVADVTIYTPGDSPQAMFELPRYVIKSGRVLVEDGEIREDFTGTTHFVKPEFDTALEPHIAQWFERAYTIRLRNYQVAESEW